MQSLDLYKEKQPFVYCLLTESKVFSAGVHLFSDWDDMDDANLQKLKLKCGAAIPADFDGTSDVHKYLDGGLLSTTPVMLVDTTLKAIEDIVVGDVLLDCNDGKKESIVVLGIVKIDALNIPVVTYSDTGITGTRNLLIGMKNSIDLGGLEATLAFKDDAYEMYEAEEDVQYLYHLLTDKGLFFIKGLKDLPVQVGDYNTGLDKYLL